MREYSYPCSVFDFDAGHERQLQTMIEVEAFINTRLTSSDPSQVRDGLSNILYWGHYRSRGRREERVRKLRENVDRSKLLAVIDAFRRTDISIRQLKNLSLPEFSNFSFLSKLRTFLDPTRYCVIDLKLLTIEALQGRFKQYPTYIPVTIENEKSYQWWVRLCTTAAHAVTEDQVFRPVDAERGFFHLVDSGKAELASILISEFGREKVR